MSFICHLVILFKNSVMLIVQVFGEKKIVSFFWNAFFTSSEDFLIKRSKKFETYKMGFLMQSILQEGYLHRHFCVVLQAAISKL